MISVRQPGPADGLRFHRVYTGASDLEGQASAFSFASSALTTVVRSFSHRFWNSCLLVAS